MNIIGIECGIGSMMIPSKELGFNILGNFEQRRCFDTGTFEENFNSNFFINEKELKYITDVDILFSHPKCSEFSSLNSGKKGEKFHDGFLSLIKCIDRLKPSFFLIDNLPKSLSYYPMSWWSKQLLEYDIVPEIISNYHYGNVQCNRDRLFLIGSLKKFEFIFIPNENKNSIKLRNVLKNVENKYNHDLFPNNMKAPGFSPYTIEQTRLIIKNLNSKGTVFYRKLKTGMSYSNKKSKGFKQRIGTMILNSNKKCPTLTSNLGFYLNDLQRPLTCRERARIQGCPDWFKFIFNEKQLFSQTMGDQTGKFIPVEFTRYFTRYVNSFLNGGKIEFSGKRYAKHPLVHREKMENCRKFGHSNMEELCNVCSFKNCRIRIKNGKNV